MPIRFQAEEYFYEGQRHRGRFSEPPAAGPSSTLSRCRSYARYAVASALNGNRRRRTQSDVFRRPPLP